MGSCAAGSDIAGIGTSTRRRFLETLAGGAVVLTASHLARAQAAARPRRQPALTVSRLRDRLAIVSGSGGNVVALCGADEMLLVDSGLAERSSDLVEALAQLPGGRKIRTVFNTHWHWDHTGGNELLRRNGAQIIAHENTKLWLLTEVRVEWQSCTYPPRPPEAWPTNTFYTSGTINFSGEPIEYGHLPQAHTDGDLYVFFRGQNVLVPGCIVSAATYPIIDYCTDGWIGGMNRALDKLVGMIDDQTRIVPGTGPVLTRADLIAEHEMLTEVQGLVWDLMRKGYGADDMIAAEVTRKYDPKWGSPDQFIRAVYKGLYAHARDIGGAV